MFLTTTAELPLDQAGIYALLGYGMVFFGLILLMVVVVLLGKAFTAAANSKTTAAPAVPAAPAVHVPQAPGAAGGVKLYNVDPKTAAILMAIVADKLQKPINELRFISVKEVTQ